MGRGTIELATFLVRELGLMVRLLGIDPDESRIKTAKQKLSFTNVKFTVAGSETEFVCDYYDLNFSCLVFQ